MLFKEIFRILGVFFLFFSIAFLVPSAVAFYYEFIAEPIYHPAPHTTVDFLIAFGICLSAGAALYSLSGKSTGTFYRKEGIASVVLIWFLVPALGALPFITSGTIKNPFQAYFEMVSGFTTTGSTILHAKRYNDQGAEVPIEKTIPGVIPTTYVFYGTVEPVRDPNTGAVIKEGVEAVGKTLLFWRSFTQWLGGVGIIVLFVAVLPALGMGGKLLFQSEVSSSTQDGVTPRIKQAALQLWRVYLILTAIQICALMLTNPALSFFDAVAVSFSTLSTGGFSTQNTSIAGYHNPATEWVVIVFMILGGVNFSLYHFVFKGKLYRLLQPEFIVYLATLGALSLLVIAALFGASSADIINGKEGASNVSPPIRTGIFHLVSAMTSTGFSTKNFNLWPYTAQSLLLIAMYIGGMAGSTAGGMKILRQIILFKSTQYRLESSFRPEQVRVFRVGDRDLDFRMVTGVLCFLCIVVALSGLGTVSYIYDGIDPETALSLTVCMLNNTGMTFRMAGPEYSCAFLSNFSLTLSSLLMIFGRLEYYAVLAMFVPAFWRQDS